MKDVEVTIGVDLRKWQYTVYIHHSTVKEIMEFKIPPAELLADYAGGYRWLVVESLAGKVVLPSEMFEMLQTEVISDKVLGTAYEILKSYQESGKPLPAKIDQI